MKTITICGKEYEIACSAFTYVQYEKIFHTSIFDDMEILKDYLVAQTLTANKLKEKNPNLNENEILTLLGSAMTKKLGKFISAITRVAYILIYSANEKIPEYEIWLKSVESLKITDEWIVEVTEFAVDCFC